MARADEPCGTWEHNGWIPGTISWTADANGDPQASISAATEICEWNDPCESTTEPTQFNPVGYVLVSDTVVAEGNGYSRVYNWRADPGCAGGSPIWATSSHPLPRHWEPPPAITGGELNGDPEREVETGDELPVSVDTAHDNDTWRVRGGHTGQSGDNVTYAWSATGGSFQGATDGRTATWVAPAEEGVYTVTCTVNDEPTPVQPPDLGSRDDSPIERTITVTVKLPKPSMTFSGLARACAGGVALDGVHDFTITGIAKRGEQIAANTSFKFTFANNRGHDYSNDPPDIKPNGWETSQIKKAKFVTTNGQGQTVLVEEVVLTTDAQGNLPIHVLSSDIVCQDIAIKVWWRESAENEYEEVGSRNCDFATMISIRRFGLADYINEEDTGWIFEAESLFDQEGDTTPAKVYLKYQINPTVPIDTVYFNQDGTVRHPLSDDGNWKFVNGHKLRVKIVEILKADGDAVPENEFPDYATLVQGGTNPVDFIDLITTNDGAAQTTIKAGPLIWQCAIITLEAVDLSQYDQ